jgi:hypothetical protein
MRKVGISLASLQRIDGPPHPRHVADHGNLSCRACGHLWPVIQKSLAVP